jgi:putative oxidoreductase
MSFELGMLVLRLTVGLLMFGHGAQKLFGWFGGYGLQGTSGFFGGQLRLRPASFWTFVAATSEAGGGLLLALGLLNPVGPIAIIASTVMAIILAHWPRLWSQNNGMEYLLVLIAASLASALSGPGAWSLDSALGISLPMPETLVAGLVLALVGILAALVTRTPVAKAAPAELKPAA